MKKNFRMLQPVEYGSPCKYILILLQIRKEFTIRAKEHTIERNQLRGEAI